MNDCYMYVCLYVIGLHPPKPFIPCSLVACKTASSYDVFLNELPPEMTSPSLSHCTFMPLTPGDSGTSDKYQLGVLRFLHACSPFSRGRSLKGSRLQSKSGPQRAGPCEGLATDRQQFPATGPMVGLSPADFGRRVWVMCGRRSRRCRLRPRRARRSAQQTYEDKAFRRRAGANRTST